MDFGWALQQLREGKKVRRQDWVGNWNAWLMLMEAKDWSNDIPLETGGPLGRDCLSWVGSKNQDDSFGPWNPAHADLLADDWEIVG